MRKYLSITALLLLALSLNGQVGSLRKTIVLSATSGDTEIIPTANGATTWKIWEINISMAATTDLVYLQGTGSACGTGQVAVSGTFKTVQSIMDKRASGTILELLPGRAFCINFSTASTGGGYIIYSN